MTSMIGLTTQGLQDWIAEREMIGSDEEYEGMTDEEISIIQSWKAEILEASRKWLNHEYSRIHYDNRQAHRSNERRINAKYAGMLNEVRA